MQFDHHRARKMIDELETGSETKASMLEAFERKVELSDAIFFFNEPFTPISLTGTSCPHQCRHCGSYYLKHMLDGSDGKLYNLAADLAQNGAKGILISGGSSRDGSVPAYAHAEVIKKIKQDKNLKISAHTGIVNRSQAQVLSGFLDMALVDVIGDDGTVHDILNLDAGAEDYERTLKEISSAGIALAPHIIVGLDKGKLKGEFRALEIAKEFDPEAVVIVVFIPTGGTDLGEIPPPDVEDVVRVITEARMMFNVPLSLSCVRPGGRYRSTLDTYAILSGIDRIAVPSRSAYTTSRRLGLSVIEIPKMCCSYKVSI